MQEVVIDKPYEFFPAYRGTFLARLLRKYLVPRVLRRSFGVVEAECTGGEKIREALAAGHGVLVTPNHPRPSDPLSLIHLSTATDSFLYVMASWHLFMQGRLQRYLLRVMGGFSIYREGTDRPALKYSMEILEKGERPLVIFPEGAVSRTNDRLNALMPGTATIARGAARNRAARDGGQVWVFPVAIRYHFLGDIERALDPVLEEIEKRLSWQPQKGMSLIDRVRKLGRALLGLKEIEHLGETQSGTLFERVARLIDHLLHPIEEEWLSKLEQGSVVSRVKRLRGRILEGMVHENLDDEERHRRWHQLSQLYLAQQLSLYPSHYLSPDSPPERFLETVERFEEDLTDVARPHPPLKVTLHVCDGIEVSTDKGSDSELLMAEIESRLAQALGIADGGDA